VPEDPPLPPAAGRAAAPERAEVPPFPYADTFELQSKPGSKRTIYLDFNGHTTTGTQWNNDPEYKTPGFFTAGAFNLEGLATTFSNYEREVIQSIYLRVAEDYAPFDVNVTTKDLG